MCGWVRRAGEVVFNKKKLPLHWSVHPSTGLTFLVTCVNTINVSKHQWISRYTRMSKDNMAVIDTVKHSFTSLGIRPHSSQIFQLLSSESIMSVE